MSDLLFSHPVHFNLPDKTSGEDFMRTTQFALAVAISAIASNSMAGTLDDGDYGCYIGNSFLGAIQIAGNVYRGPAFDGKYEGDYSYSVSDQGTIDWGGPLGGISSGGNKIASTVLTDAGNGRHGYDITIQNSEGNFQSISCSPQ
jgi:hypothetical protein